MAQHDTRKVNCAAHEIGSYYVNGAGEGRVYIEAMHVCDNCQFCIGW